MVYLEFGTWRAEIEPDCGCNLTVLSCDGEQILRSPESTEKLMERPCLYGIPLIFPANRTRGGKFCFRGKEYQLTLNEPSLNNHIHGLLKDAPFSVTEQTPNSVTARLVNKGDLYPFPFEMVISDTLSENGLTRKLTLKNTGSEPMPYTLGFHTTFLEPESFSVPLKDRYEMDDTHIPTGRLLPLTPDQQAYSQGFTPNGTRISGCYRTCGQAVRIGKFTMTVSEQFDHWVLFNGTGKEVFLCIEPMCGTVDGLNNGKHRILHPGAQEVFLLHIG